MAAALALPLTLQSGEEFPFRHLILFLTFCVIFVTLVLQGLTLPFVAKWLGVEEGGDEYQSEIEARELLLKEIIEKIGKEARAVESAEQRDSLEQWQDYYEERLRRMQQRDSLSLETNRNSAPREKELMVRLTEEARRHLAELRRRGIISENVRQRIEYDFDLEEQRIQRILSRFE